MFKLEFNTDNDAFTGLVSRTEEIKRILDVVQIAVANGYFNGAILDINGNHVGNWEINSTHS